MSRSTYKRILYSLVLAALLLSAVAPASTAPASTPVPAQAPAPSQAPPPPGGATRFLPPADPPAAPAAPPAAPAPAQPEVEVLPEPAAATAPEAAQAPSQCGPAPQTLPLGQDLELLLGPPWGYSGDRVSQTPAWGATAKLSVKGTMTRSVTGCTSTGPQPEEVYLMKHSLTNYTDCGVMGPGDDVTLAGVGNDELSCVKVGGNVELTVFKHYIDLGETKVFASGSQSCDMGAVGNDEASADRVILTPHATGNIAAADWGTDRIMAAYKTVSTTNELAIQAWNASSGWSGMMRMGLAIAGNPALVRRGMYWVLFARSGNTIKYKTSDATGATWSAWKSDLNITTANSDPAVVSPTPNHIKLFYRNTSNQVYFTEWEGGRGWRSVPVSLGAPSGTTIVSELSAIARDENHVAVFGVGANGYLYVREWKKGNQADWSDAAAWTEVWMSDTTTRVAVKNAKPAVASRHSGHVGVAVLSTSGAPYYREWSAAQYDDNLGTPRGWRTAVSLGGGLSTLGLVATGMDEMYAYGVNSGGQFYTNKFTRSGTTDTWSGWGAGEAGWAADGIAAAVAGRPQELLLVGRATDDRLQLKRFTNQGQGLTAQYNSHPGYGSPRSQAVATVGGKTYRVSAYRNSIGEWTLEARRTDAWATAYTLVMSSTHPANTTETDRVAVAAGDIDLDGDDEIVVATMRESPSDNKWYWSINKLGRSGSTITGLVKKYGTGTAFSFYISDVQVAVGDIDGDGVENEVSVAARKTSNNNAHVRSYHINPNYSIVSLYGGDVTVGGASGWDLEMTMGKVDDSILVHNRAVDHLVVSSSGCSGSSCGYQLRTLDVYTATTDAGAGWHMDPGYDSGLVYTTTTQALGAYSSALATGDVDSDGLDEVIYTYGRQILTYNVAGANTVSLTASTVASTDANRGLAVGDMDADGRAEVVYSRGSYGAGWTGIYKQMFPESTSLTLVGSQSFGGVPLLADLDGDSAVATFQECYEFSEVRVLSVANGQPVWYGDDGEPIPTQGAGGGLANWSGASNAAEDAWTCSLGGSISAGFKQEWSTPILAIKLGEVRFSVTQEFMGSFGGGTERETSVVEASGAEFEGFGKVCYAETTYHCSTYTVSKPGSSYSYTAMICLPVPIEGTAGQTCKPFSDWYDPTFIASAGDSWIPVGHHTTQSGPNVLSYNVAHYPVRSTPPLTDTQSLWWVKTDPIDISGTNDPSQPGTNWSVQQSEGQTNFTTGSFEESTTVSAGADVLGITLDTSVTAGYGTEWSNSIGWETGMEFSGDIYHYPGSTAGPYNPNPCPTTICKNYSVKPYVYKAQATVPGGTYSYFVQDYFLTARSTSATPSTAQATAPSVVGLVPKAPVVSSATHPDPATWYSTDTAVLSWGQPAGDPAVVIGYKWNLDRSPATTPTAAWELTTTHTYKSLDDGVYYLHIQAVGDGGDRGPVTHRAVRVDVDSPQVEILANPFAPDGFNGWYITPVTVTVAATDTNGSGVAAVQTSTNGTTWTTYSAPIPVTANTPGYTLWARATDSLGHVSDVVSTTFKLDRTPPSVRDKDRYGISYARLITDEVGNMQLVLGGAISDTLSGRLQVEVKAGDTGAWNAVSVVGDLPMPPGNWLSTTMTSLQWMYTPTFEIRGAYPLYVRGLDKAGNYGHYYSNTLIMPGGCVWWDPIDVPVLDESRVSVWPHRANPGDVVAFTVAARNSGYQEAQYLITDTVPVGLTVLPDSISDDGQYNASTREITWLLHGLWPGQTRYLSFQATADSAATTATLENQVDLMAYWPWDRSCDPRVPPEPARHYYSTSTTLTVRPGAPMGVRAASTAQIVGAAVAEGEIVGDPDVTLVVNASPEARSLYVREWVWNGILNVWKLAQESGWVPFEAAAGLAVSEDNIGKYGRYDWTLSEGDGVKYLGIWVADEDGQISNLSEGNLIYTNLMSAGGQGLAAGQRAQYRVTMRAQQLAVLTLVSLSGDADLYVWKPRAGLKPHYYSNAVPTGSGLALDTVGFYAGEEGMYVIEVQAATDATYRLVTAGDIAGAGLLAETQGEDLPPSTHLALAEKARPARPVTLTTPFSLWGAEQLPEATRIYKYYLPLISRR